MALLRSLRHLPLFFALFLSAQSRAEDTRWDKIYTQVKPSIPYIYSNGGLCSGALIQSNLILTAKHCVDSLRQTWVAWPSSPGKWEPAEVIYMHSKLDFALIKVDPKLDLTPIPLRDIEYVKEGEDAATIGHPTSGKVFLNPPFDLELTHVFSAGKISKNTGTELVVDLSISPGNSGGPLIDSKGRVIGVISRKLITQFVGNVGYAVSHNAALAALSLYKQGKLQSPEISDIAPTFSIGITPTWDAVQNNFSGMSSTYRTTFIFEYTMAERLFINYQSSFGLNNINFSSWGLGWKFQGNLSNKVPVYFKPQIETLSYNPKQAPAEYHSVGYTAELGMGGLPVGLRFSLLRAYGASSFLFGLRVGN